MGCNCGKSRRTPPPPPPPPPSTGVTQSFVLTTPDARVQRFGSALEARAARIRAGGVGQIEVLHG